MTRDCGKLALFLLLPLLLEARPQTISSKAASDAETGKRYFNPLMGAWEVAVDDKVGSMKENNPNLTANSIPRKKVVVLQVDGDHLLVLDPETKQSLDGKTSDEGKAITFTWKGDRNGVSYKPVVFRGSISGNTIAGTATLDDGAAVEWKAVKLPSAWECSNHKNPSHVAASEEEMRDLTMKYKCSGWHRLKID